MPFLTVHGVRLHYETIGGDPSLPPLVFLHEGLGSVELWRGFPDAVAQATGQRTLVFSRHGHGWSDALVAPRPADFMDREALVTLPAVLEATGTEDPILVGHSDGASIALIHAADPSTRVVAVVALAPHVFVEPKALAGGREAVRAFHESDLADRMAKYHRDPESTFRAWSETWLSPGFRSWNIEDRLGGIDCPLLVIQGSEDEYGTSAQIDAIEREVAGPVETLWLDGCRHSPHLDRPEETLAATAAFIRRVREA